MKALFNYYIQNENGITRKLKRKPTEKFIWNAEENGDIIIIENKRTGRLQRYTFAIISYYDLFNVEIKKLLQ